MINKKPLIGAKITEFSREMTDYSFCDIILSALKVKFPDKEITKWDLLGIDDDEFYTLVSKAFEKEKKFLK